MELPSLHLLLWTYNPESHDNFIIIVVVIVDVSSNSSIIPVQMSDKCSHTIRVNPRN